MNIYLDRCWLGERIGQLEISGDISDDEVSLEDFLSQGLSIDGDISSSPAWLINHC